MTPEQKEAFYDSDLAPALLDLCKRAQDAGLSFHAVVEWDAGSTASTTSMQAGAGPGIRHAVVATRAGSNLDGLVMALMREARESGHRSICMDALRVPREPSR